MKKSITLASATLAALTLVSVASTASAGTVTPTTDQTNAGVVSAWDSTAKVAFTANTTVPPVTNPSVPTSPSIPGVTGDFAIDYASDLDFGTHQVQTGTQIYYAKADALTNGAPQVRMHDQRGAVKGWNVTVQQKGQFVDGTTALAGAAITFTNGKAYDVAGSGTLATNAATAVGTSLTLDPAATTGTQVMSGDGTVGGYATVYGDSAAYQANTDGTKATSVSLSVPSAKAGNFSTTLEYTLSAVQ